MIDSFPAATKAFSSANLTRLSKEGIAINREHYGAEGCLAKLFAIYERAMVNLEVANGVREAKAAAKRT